MNDCPRQNPAYRPTPTSIHEPEYSHGAPPRCLVVKMRPRPVGGCPSGSWLRGPCGTAVASDRPKRGRSYSTSLILDELDRPSRPIVPRPPDTPRVEIAPATSARRASRNLGSLLPHRGPRGCSMQDRNPPGADYRATRDGPSVSCVEHPGGASNALHCRRSCPDFDRSSPKSLARLTLPFEVSIVHFSGNMW